MKFFFEARIYKVGINPCVKVPGKITARMIAKRGYIPIKGRINNHSFFQTLVPVKNAEYRLYVNGPMLKGAGVKNGDRVRFSIEQNFEPRIVETSVPKEFRKRLKEGGLEPAFRKLIPSRQKEILRYMNYLKTEEALLRNIDKTIRQLKALKIN
jgi:hypothetical protein